MLFKDKRWESIRLYHSNKFKSLIGKNALEISKELGKPPLDALMDIMVEEADNMFGVLIMGKIKAEEDLVKLIELPYTGVISDGVSLSKRGCLAQINWSPGCFGWTAHYFKKYVGPDMLTIEQAVNKITGLPTQRLGLSRRGLIKPGYIADITVFCYERLKDMTSLKRPAAYPQGIELVVLNGKIVVLKGKLTGLRAGKVIRRV